MNSKFARKRENEKEKGREGEEPSRGKHKFVKNAREISRKKRRRGERGKNRVREEFDFALAVGGKRAEFVKNACERARKKGGGEGGRRTEFMQNAILLL